MPTAERVIVMRNGSGSVEMVRRHPAGMFEALLTGHEGNPGLPSAGRCIAAASTTEIDDPYRYGRVLTDYDLYLFGEGKHTRIYEKLGAHPMTIGNATGVHFAVWAPNAKRVSVVGDFNGWDGRRHPMRSLGASGVWEIFIPGLSVGEKYKFEILTRFGEVVAEIRSVWIRVRTTTAERFDRHRTASTSGKTPSGCDRVKRPTPGFIAR